MASLARVARAESGPTTQTASRPRRRRDIASARGLRRVCLCLHAYPRLLRYGVVGVEYRTVWSDGVRQCLLRRSETALELLRYCEGRIVRLKTCEDERRAWTTADEW